jgi:hypothetical protein
MTADDSTDSASDAASDMKRASRAPRRAGRGRVSLVLMLLGMPVAGAGAALSGTLQPSVGLAVALFGGLLCAAGIRGLLRANLPSSDSPG